MDNFINIYPIDYINLGLPASLFYIFYCFSIYMTFNVVQKLQTCEYYILIFVISEDLIAINVL